MKSKLYLERIKKLQQQLKEKHLSVFLVEDPTDLFYLTGMKLSLGYLYIATDQARLFVDGRYFEAATENSPVPVSLLGEEGQIEFLRGKKVLGFDGEHTSYARVSSLKKLCEKVHVQIESHDEILKNMRLIKDAGEIRKMQASAKFKYQAYQRLRKKLRVGMTEIALANQFKMDCLKHGVEQLSFEPIIAFGKNSALPHHHPGNTKLKANDIVLFDLGIVFDDYCSDMTRVHFVGKPNPLLKKIYEVNHAAQKAALAKCRPGVHIKELDLAARKVMADAGMEEYFIHGLGHGIGLKVHEYPRIKHDGPDRDLKLEPGMAITIEPGLYLPGKGGVRYEDTIIITPKGYMNLYPES